MATEIQIRRRKVLMAARHDGRFQFGQPGVTRINVPESVGCGPNAIQNVALAWGKRVTMDNVLSAAGSPDIWQQEGLLTHQVTLAMQTLGLPYEGVYDKTAAELAEIAKHRGPCIFLCQYDFWPQWKGASVGDIQANGKPNGYARPLGHAGRNDLRFTGGHYGVLLSTLYRPRLKDIDVWVRDPDHNSPARPQTPHMDVINGKQWGKLYDSAALFTHGAIKYAAIPTQAL